MKTLLKKLASPIFFLLFLITPIIALAQNTSSSTIVKGQMLDKLKKVGIGGGYNPGVTPQEIIGFIIGAFINFLGLVFIILIIVAGYGWMTANGNEEKIKKSVTTLKEAIIGLVLTLSAWTLWNFVLENLVLKGPSIGQ